MDNHVSDLVTRYPTLAGCAPDVTRAVDLLVSVFEGGGKLLTCGNGGSAADSDHIVAELMKGFNLPRSVPASVRQRLPALDGELADRLQGALPAISLAANGALLTAVANDVAADMGFAQQVYGYGTNADALLAISTSGNSTNVLNAAKVARALGLRTIGLTGRTGGRLAELCDVAIRVPADVTSEVQELHLPVYHAVCSMVEEWFFGGGVSGRRYNTP